MTTDAPKKSLLVPALCLLTLGTLVLSLILVFGVKEPAPVASGPAMEYNHPKRLYLDLMQRSLTDLIYEDDPKGRKARLTGHDWPSRGYTMIGIKRLKNIQFCMEDTIRNNVPGDYIECGAWRGGATIFMRAILEVNGIKDRKVWVADSFEGLPPPNIKDYPADEGLDLSGIEELAVGVDLVKEHFRRYDLLDNQVVFLKGWFKDTLPDAPIEKLAVLRVDADLYESTTQALEYLYPKVSSGGYVIIDDMYIPACTKAVHDFREKNGITAELKKIDFTGQFWQKE